ncbi:MAG: lipopolysaccharide biosynthesis protein [Eubacteriales bacterium]|nr:lipopolysaccharide biosynthesis protein [Eubacteriales bacterium]
MEERKQNARSRDFLWNMAGSLIYALSSMVLAFFVMRVQGAEDGGIFGFGFSTFGQQLFIVAYFGIRPFHITDVKREYSFGEYRRLRCLSAAAAVLIAVLYLFVLFAAGMYSGHKAAVILLLAFYKICDGYGDVYESEFQRDGKLYLSGQLLSLRTIVCAGAFMAVLLFFHDLLLAALAAVILQLLMLLLYRSAAGRNFPLGKESGALDYSRRREAVYGLFRRTLLLFLSVFLDFYVFSAAKYAVDFCMKDADNGIFNILFMPTSVIYLVANFIIRPFMTELAAAYEKHDFEVFTARLFSLQKLILLLTAVAYALAMLLGGVVLGIGEMVLGEAYAGQLVPYKSAFANIIFGGGIYAMANLYYYILVILRRQRQIFYVYAAAAILAFIGARLLVAGYGLYGAAMCYELLMAVLCAGFFVIGNRSIRQEAMKGGDGCAD